VSESQAGLPLRVSTLELFFDPVFEVTVSLALSAVLGLALAAEDEVPAATGVWGAGPSGGTSVGA